MSTEIEPTRKQRSPRKREPRGWGSGFVGAVVEAWDEVRIHRTRVLLSLVGVGVAVCALTTVVGLGAIAQQAQIEQLERGSGRPASLVMGVPFNPITGTQGDVGTFESALSTAVDRYSITYSGSVVWMPMTIQFRDGVSIAESAQGVDVDYGVMHRVQVSEGRWFVEQDESRLAPALVVNDAFWQRLGYPDLQTHPTVTLIGDSDVTAVIVGVTPAPAYQEGPRLFMLNSAARSVVSATVLAESYPQYELWVPPELAPELTELLRRDVSAAFGDGWVVDINRQDYLAWEGGGDPLGPIRMVLAGISVLILLLGALGLVNISLVTVRQRIREIGVRRSFGATASRVFFAVMMESVVATVVAGFVGVVIAVAIVKNPWVLSMVASGLNDVPPFPVEAAVIGIGAATLVGALAGLLPALVAVRVKVIDAIRY